MEATSLGANFANKHLLFKHLVLPLIFLDIWANVCNVDLLLESLRKSRRPYHLRPLDLIVAILRPTHMTMLKLESYFTYNTLPRVCVDAYGSCFVQQVHEDSDSYWQKISCTTAKNDCFSTHNVQKKKFKTMLKTVYKISITTDMWKSPGQKIHYMVVTGHFVDNDWKLQKHVLGFCYVPPPHKVSLHKGVIISDALYKFILDWGIYKFILDWGIENKVASIIVYNASYNYVALRNLKGTFKLLKKKLLFDGKLLHVRCCAHIFNLLVQDGLSTIKDIIGCVQDGVKYLVSSKSCINLFSQIAKQLQLPYKKLILDFPTRWNSAYDMLFVTLEFRDVFPRYGERDVGFVYVPTYEDWEKVDSVSKYLEIFDDVTNIISRSEYPTSNLFLPKVWRIKQTLDKYLKEGEEYLQTMASKMKVKFKKYWGELNLLMALGAALDPRQKMKLVGFCFPEIYNQVDANANISMMHNLLYQFYDVHVVMHFEIFNKESSQQSTTEAYSLNNGIQSKKVVTGKSRYKSFIRMSDKIQPVKSDMDIYLEENVYICNGVEWWKANNLKYCILSKMACDILSIPITSMASEAAFSAGSRIIDSYRASLATETVERLLCGGDWVGALYGLKRGSDVKEPKHKEFTLP